MPGTFRKGDIVQRLQGGQVMTVVGVRERADGVVLIDAVVVHGDEQQAEQYLPEELKVIGIDRDEDFGDDHDDDHGD